MTNSNCLFGNISTFYMASAQSLIFWLLRIIFPLHISQLFVYRKSTNYFTTGNRLNISLLCTENLYDKFKLPIWKHFDDLYGFCAKPNFLAAAHHFPTAYLPIICLLQIDQLFHHRKSSKYLVNLHRKIV